MPTYIEAATGREIPASLALYADGQPKPGVSVRNGPMQDGDYVAFSPFLMDGGADRSGQNSRFVTDNGSYQFDGPRQIVTDRDAVDAQRRRWMADKAMSHRIAPIAKPVPVSVPRAFLDRPPTHSAAAGRAAIDQGRKVWLADKRNAHRNPQRD